MKRLVSTSFGLNRSDGLTPSVTRAATAASPTERAPVSPSAPPGGAATSPS